MVRYGRQRPTVATELHYRYTLVLTMRIFYSIVCVTIYSFTVIAKANVGSRFSEYNNEYLSSPPLRLHDSSYESLTSEPRNHTAIVLLTALDARFGCQLCKDFQPEWDVLAKSSVKADSRGMNRIIYGTLDFADGKGTFQKVHMEFSCQNAQADSTQHC